jgi:thioredoxin-related protein
MADLVVWSSSLGWIPFTCAAQQSEGLSKKSRRQHGNTLRQRKEAKSMEEEKKGKKSTNLEKATNIAIIVACIVLVGNLARNYYLSYKPNPSPAPEIAKGTVVKLPGSVPTNPQPTLVLALSKHCHFCQESVGFYQKLTALKNSSSHGLRMVAVLPEKQEEAEGYLKEQGIGVDEVISMPVSKLGVRGTPTLLLLDSQNKLEELWIGKLDDSQESQVMERLKKACSGCSLPKAEMRLRASPKGSRRG